MATTNPVTLKLSESDNSPVSVYRGTKKRKMPDVSQWAGMNIPDIEESFYQDVAGNPITNFDPKTHTIVGDIRDGIRVPHGKDQPMPSWMPKFAPAYSGPMARQQPYSGPMARPTGNQAAPLKIPSLKPQSTPDAVRASAQTSPAQDSRQKTIAEEQADYIRRKGGRLASDADAEMEQGLREMYRKSTGFDLNSAAGRQASFEAALQRGGHADAMARNLKAGKYAYLDTNSDAGMRASEAARQKLFTGNDWVGDNQLTGQYKDVENNVWDSQDAYNQSGMNPNAPKVEPSREILTDEQRAASTIRGLETNYDPEMMQFSFFRDQLNPTGRSMRRFQETEAQDYANKAIADSIKERDAPVMGPDMKGWSNQVANFLRARVGANAEGDDSLDNMGTGEYFDPNFLHRTKGNAVNDLGRDPSAGYAPDTDNVSGFTNGFGVRVPLPNENFRLPSMPQGDVEDAIDARSFGNAMRPSQPRFAPYGRPLGPMNLNKPSMNIRVPMDRPKFK